MILACLSGIFLIGKDLPSELAPLEDRNRLRASILGPEGTDFDYMDRAIYDITQQMIDSIPERYVLLSFAP